MPRKEIVTRKTKETNIKLELNLDGSGKSDITTPVPFLNHVLDSFARHGKFDLTITASGDINVDPHHLIEDIGICLGLAVSACLKNKEGITRFGHTVLPMDEVEISISLDLGGRAYLRYNVDMLNEKIENMNTGLVEDFFRALVNNCHANLHISKNVGINSHHIIEAIFKAFGIVLKNATRLSGGTSIPSTKGVI